MICWRVGCLLLGLAVLSDAKKKKQFKFRTRSSEEIVDANIPSDQWFHQALDHYDITSSSTWKQRYHVIDEHYKEGGLVFLLIEGEWEISAELMKTNAAVDYAKKCNAIVFQLEHRYYGKSRPTIDLSVSNLRYLSVDQALADTAFFIAGMNSHYKLPKGTKWIAFGSSYSANLAAWMRDKFPHLVYASVAYSGPVLAKLNFFEYKTVVRESLKSVNKECVTAVKEAHIQVKNILKEHNDLSEFTKKFNLCDPIDISIPKDVESLLETLADNIAWIVQYNHLLNTTIQAACELMMNTSIGDYIDRYAELNLLVSNEEQEECLDFKYYKDIEMMKNVSWDSKKASGGERQWFYQTCTEFGYYQTSTSKTDLFSEDIPLDFYIQACIDVFGNKFNKKLIQHGITRTNIMFGGLDVKATKVAYVFGKQDPWYPLGITTTRVPESPAIFIEGESHCACLYGTKKGDSDVFKAACDQVEALVIQWCNE